MQAGKQKRMDEMQARYSHDAALRTSYPLLCGVDEAGRGPLCGPVCVAAVILNPKDMVPELNDSKKISEKKRAALFEEIKSKALAHSVVFVWPEEIDKLNILWASMQGMQRAVQGLPQKPDFVLVDGNRLPKLAVPGQAVVKGDFVSASIAAASVVAKVCRDKYMQKLGKAYPQYQLAKHKGYPTKLHIQLLQQHGPQGFYRMSFLKKIKFANE